MLKTIQEEKNNLVFLQVIKIIQDKFLKLTYKH